MGIFGQALGRGLGMIGRHFLPISGVNGGDVGEKIGSFLPFKKGGKVVKVSKKEAYKHVISCSMGGPVPKLKHKKK
jgi:hypothetical protein